jgi:hypothetical protein
MARKTHNCLWRKSEGAAVTANLNVDNFSGNGRNEGKTDERNEHDWQVRMRVG